VEDAIVIDNSHMTFADQVEKVIQLAKEKMAANV
jgi:cytidylate kinase